MSTGWRLLTIRSPSPADEDLVQCFRLSVRCTSRQQTCGQLQNSSPEPLVSFSSTVTTARCDIIPLCDPNTASSCRSTQQLSQITAFNHELPDPERLTARFTPSRAAASNLFLTERFSCRLTTNQSRAKRWTTNQSRAPRRAHVRGVLPSSGPGKTCGSRRAFQRLSLPCNPLSQQAIRNSSRSPTAVLNHIRCPSAGLTHSRRPSAGLTHSRSPSAGLTHNRGLTHSRRPSAGLTHSRSTSARLVLK